MLVVLAGAAEMERNLTRERVTAALAVKRANGQRAGGVPYGFDLADDGTNLVENPDELAEVERMEQHQADGWTLRAIAEDLTARGVPTKQGNGKWTHQAVASILKRNRRAAA